MTSLGMPQIWFGLSVLAIARHVKVQQIQKTLGDAAKQLATLRPGRHHQHLPRAAEVWALDLAVIGAEDTSKNLSYQA